VPEWIDLRRAIIGDFLGRISRDTYEEAGFLASAVAVSSATQEPSEGFRALANELGLSAPRGDEFLAFWIEQVRKAQRWYAVHPVTVA